MNGFIEVPTLKRKFFYTYEDGSLTVYSKNSLPLETSTNLAITSDCDYVIGTVTEESSLVVFFVDRVPFSDSSGIILTSTTVRVYFYIDHLKQDRPFLPSSLKVTFEELNYFFDLNTGLKRFVDLKGKTQKVETLPYEDTKETFSFYYDCVQIKGELGIIQTLNGYSTTPLELHSQLKLEFAATSNIEFLADLCSVLNRLFYFLCYRSNVQISPIEFWGVNEDGKKCSMGIFYPLFSQCEYLEEHKVIKKTIKYDIVKEHFSDLIQSIANNQLYFEHIPETHSDGHHITVARTILTTAAFEWTYQQQYQNIPLSQYRQEVKEDIMDMLAQLPVEKKYNSKKKGEIRHYTQTVERMDRNLSEKIQIALTDCKGILQPFISRLYELNDMQEESFAQIANDLQYQRNAYAHGAIDRELKENIILDVLILEWLIYCMVLKQLKYDEVDIFNAINHIFERGFADKPKGGGIQ